MRMIIIIASAILALWSQARAQTSLDAVVSGKIKQASPFSAATDTGVPEKAPAVRTVKSVKKAFFLSLALPGAGEYYVGQKAYTKGFLAAEVVIWSFALLSRYQGNVWRDDYIAFAAVQAGANPQRRDEEYYRDIYEWPNSYWYNEYQWVEARDLYPDDPAAQAAYVADKLYSDADSWEWSNYQDWDRFRSLRIKSENAYRRITYALGTALLNHVLSAVNAARLAKGYNQKAKQKRFTWDLEVSPRDEGLALRLRGSF